MNTLNFFSLEGIAIVHRRQGINSQLPHVAIVTGNVLPPLNDGDGELIELRRYRSRECIRVTREQFSKFYQWAP